MPRTFAFILLAAVSALAGSAIVLACGGDDEAPSGCQGSECGLSLTWVTKPGDFRCPLGLRCRYEVAVDGGGAGEITSWDWTFGDAGVVGADAAIEYAYPTPGTYPVTVTAKVKDGKTGASLDAVEHVCVDDPEGDCEPGSDDCCSGTCTVARRCR